MQTKFLNQLPYVQIFQIIADTGLHKYAEKMPLSSTALVNTKHFQR